MGKTSKYELVCGVGSWIWCPSNLIKEKFLSVRFNLLQTGRWVLEHRSGTGFIGFTLETPSKVNLYPRVKHRYKSTCNFNYTGFIGPGVYVVGDILSSLLKYTLFSKSYR